MVKYTNRTVNSFYEYWDGDECVYCGEVAQVMDHAYPAMAEPMQAPPGMLIIVPSCSECNAIAGALVHFTLRERREYIQDHLNRKYKKLLEAPDWSDDEISELRGRLRESVLCSQESKRRIKLRIRYDG